MTHKYGGTWGCLVSTEFSGERLPDTSCPLPLPFYDSGGGAGGNRFHVKGGGKGVLCLIPREKVHGCVRRPSPLTVRLYVGECGFEQ